MYITQQYDNIIEDILLQGNKKSNRTGIDTLSMVGCQGVYEIDKCFPIITKRKYPYKSIFAELLWMLSGSTNINDLEAMGSKIWTPWRDKSFEDRNGYDDGCIGPSYGWQFRNFGGNYPDRSTGFDQIQYIVNELKTNKYSRRILVNLWNPMDMTSDRVRLPCCHYSFQILVDDEDTMTGILSQRSCDYPIGVPANIIFYSALLYMLGQQTGLRPYYLIHNGGDCHIYENQIDGVKRYMDQKAYDSPKLVLNKANSIFDYKLDDFQIIDYESSPSIKIDIAV